MRAALCYEWAARMSVAGLDGAVSASDVTCRLSVLTDLVSSLSLRSDVVHYRGSVSVLMMRLIAGTGSATRDAKRWSLGHGKSYLAHRLRF